MNFTSNIDKKTYDSFVKKHRTKSHFLQSYEWGSFSEEEKNLKPYYVGLTNDKDKLVATALLLQKKLPFGYSYFYSPRGYVLDFSDKNLVKIFTEEILKFAKKHKAIFIKIDPDIILQNLNDDGSPTKETNNYDLIDYLKKIGYLHKGFNKNFEGSQPRYTFRLDLTQDDDSLINNFHLTTKKILKKGNINDLIILKNENAKIEDFYLTMLETEKRENILNHDIKYYRNYYEYLHSNNMSDLYVIKANIEKLKSDYQEKIKNLEKEFDELNNTDKYKNEEKRINLQKEVSNKLNKINKEFEDIKNIKDKELVLAGIITTKYNDKVWTIHGGTNSLLPSLNANYLIYYEIIKDAKKEGFKTIDFFGTTGDPKENNPIYGIHSFKKRLGGTYTEFIGEFDLVTNKFIYFIFTKLIPAYRNIKRKLLKIKKS
jgi:Uncharacterized protein involved in methicillin resistance